MYKVIMKKIEPLETHLVGYFSNPTYYEDLVKVFGKPNSKGDNYKVDAEWVGTINEKPFIIYNYKTGKNYLAEKGLNVEEITSWNIGGLNASIVQELKEHLINSLLEKPKKYKYQVSVIHEFDDEEEALEFADFQYNRNGLKTKFKKVKN